MKIAAIVGSLRKDSFNMRLARYMQEQFKHKLDIEILKIHELPFYNQDIELDPPESVKIFKHKVSMADAVLWITPEYNYSIPGVTKNAIDWLSRVDKVMKGKPSWILGSSMGFLGSVRAQLHLREILFSPSIASPFYPGNEVYIGTAHEKFNEHGELIHEPTKQYLKTVTDHFIEWMESGSWRFSTSSRV
ncbi:NADPH-dependent FMN reductase [Paenibacillus yonginensis]|uniref:NADPH-dependent FMN reductase n=1 Tax=Paenibacillus yonginensis TaxID=1462996 RepID=A0A1B1MYQ1_9BACL|nr:NADPH-dependent FMN reductase [Paenibacillus yonginensis]ANS74279.1 NADPH-dependent FMN reductase [Paenibacillus yonginensis]